MYIYICQLRMDLCVHIADKFRLVFTGPRNILERNRHYGGLLKAKAVSHTASTGHPHARTLHKEVSFICNRNKHPLPRSPSFWRSGEKISRTSSFDRNAAVHNGGSHESPDSTAGEGIGWLTALTEGTDSILRSEDLGRTFGTIFLWLKTCNTI